MAHHPRLIGHRRTGAPIYLAAGASPDDPPADPPAGDPPAPPDGDGTGGDDPPLGERGQRALDAMKVERRGLKDQLRGWSDLGVTPDQVRELLSQQEGAADRQRERELTQAAVAKANERLVSAEIRAAAKGVLADPADALRFAEYLDPGKVEVSESGEVDSDAITEQIKRLVAAKPYLAAAADKRFAGGADGGPRKGDTPSVDQQITEAQKAGNWRLVASLQNRKLTLPGG